MCRLCVGWVETCDFNANYDLLCARSSLRSKFTCKLFFNSSALKGFWCLVRFSKPLVLIPSEAPTGRRRMWFFLQHRVFIGEWGKKGKSFTEHIFHEEIKILLTKLHFVLALKIKSFGRKEKAIKWKLFCRKQNRKNMQKKTSWKESNYRNEGDKSFGEMRLSKCLRPVIQPPLPLSLWHRFHTLSCYHPMQQRNNQRSNQTFSFVSSKKSF